MATKYQKIRLKTPYFQRIVALKRRIKDLPIALLMLLPSMIILIIFVFIPLIYSFYLSLTNWNFLDARKNFVWFSNYIELFTKPLFGKVLLNTLVFTVVTIIFSFTFGLLLALVLNRKFFGRTFYRSLIFFPYITTPSALALVWVWILDPKYGLMNQFLKMFFIQGPEWLSSTAWSLIAVIIMTIWHYTGYNMVILLGGLQNINPELREAARIDGANKWHEFWNITLPLLSPTTFFLLITMMISMFQVFDVVYVMTYGGPVNSTNVLVFYLYQQGFQFFKAGYASAVAVILFFIVLTFTFMQQTLSKRWVVYD